MADDNFSIEEVTAGAIAIRTVFLGRFPPRYPHKPWELLAETTRQHFLEESLACLEAAARAKR